MTRRVLLACGILSSLLYVAMNVAAAMRFEGYSSVSQTISELSAVGAPSRSLWVGLAGIYSLLMVAFGCGVWASAGPRRSLRVVGALLITEAVIGVAWPPMHLRGAATSVTDLLHIVFTAVWAVLVFVAIGVGAGALGRRFRVYSIATIATMLVFGFLTGREAPGIPKGLPTPRIGVWERIDVAAFLLWIVALAIALLRTAPGEAPARRAVAAPGAPAAARPGR